MLLPWPLLLAVRDALPDLTPSLTLDDRPDGALALTLCEKRPECPLFWSYGLDAADLCRDARELAAEVVAAHAARVIQ